MNLHITENVKISEHKEEQAKQLYYFLSSIASQPEHPSNASAKALLLDLPRAWKVKI